MAACPLRRKLMQQQINLYNAFLEKIVEKTPLTWVRLWALTTILALYLIILSLVNAGQTYWLYSQANKATIAMNKAKNSFEKIKSSYPPIFFSDKANKEINEVQTKLEAQERIIHQLSTKAILSTYLVTLAQSTVDNVWLTKIEIVPEKNNLELHGMTYAMPDLQKLMQHLSEQALFKDAALDIKNINSAQKDDHDILNFNIAIVSK